MPLLSVAQDKHAKSGVVVIGVTAPSDRNPREKVDELLEDLDSEIRFRVGWDSSRSAWSAYMDAAGVGGIPAAFVVDKVGKIAYIGGPVTAEIAVEMILTDEWSAGSSPERLDEAYAVISGYYRYTGGGLSDEQTEKVVTALQRIEEEFAEFVPAFRPTLFSLYLSAEKHDKAGEIGAAWMAAAIKAKDAMDLNTIAWTIIDPYSDVETKDLEMARKAAKAAVRFSKKKDPAILDTLARVHACAGEWTSAVEVQRMAIKVARKAKLEDMAEELEWTLEEYLEEVEKSVETPGK